MRHLPCCCHQGSRQPKTVLTSGAVAGTDVLPCSAINVPISGEQTSITVAVVASNATNASTAVKPTTSQIPSGKTSPSTVTSTVAAVTSNLSALAIYTYYNTL